MAYKVFPYNQGSRSAKALAVELGGRVLLRKGSKYRQREEDLIINWGAVDSPFKGRRVVNQPDAIETAQNKLTCLKTLSEAGVRVPSFTDEYEDARAWCQDKDTVIMCRTLLTASEGRGIVIANTREEIVKAPLYTKYIKKKDEYRIHVLRRPGEEPEVISIQRKAKRNGAEADFKVRNLKNGFVFVRNEVRPPADVIEQATAALVASGLALGAVDVIWNEKQKKAYVLEINTAPGLEGQTIKDYANALRNI